MHRLVLASGLDLSRLQAVHVGGTNGKGSVCALLDSVLRKNGFRVGFYSSPHLLDIRERIRVDGRMISRSNFAKLAQWAAPLVRREKASAFEMLTLMAFKHFSEQKVDWSVVEVGLGGRLDATNVLNGRVSVITNVEMEHADRLGNTISEIAQEKAGIVKPGQWACITAAKGVALSVFRKKTKGSQIPLIKSRLASPAWLKHARLKGEYQRENLGVVLATLRVLQAHGLKLKKSFLVAGVRCASWPARFQRFGRFLVDGAHNPAGIHALVASLDRKKRYSLVFGVLKDKDYPSMVAELCRKLKLSRACLVRPKTPRGLDAKTLSSYFLHHGVRVQLKNDVRTALQASNGPVVVCGSLFVAADALKVLLFSGRKRNTRLRPGSARLRRLKAG